MSNQEKVEKRVKLGEEAYQRWLSQPPIQFPLHPSSPIRKAYSSSSSSHVGNGGNQIEVGMDDFFWHTSVMDVLLFNAFRDNEQGDDSHITDTFFEFLKSTSTTPLFRPRWFMST